LDPSLANAERVGPSAFFEDVGTAIGAGWVDFENGDLQVIAEIAYQRRGYALVAAPGRPTGRRDGVETYDLWLARTESRPDPDDPAVTTHRRVAAARLYAGVVASESMMDNQYDCVVESELRARDLDGDGEVEITVLASYYRPVEELETECGTAAFLVGGDDLATQARFSREYHYYSTGAGGDTGEVRDTAWQVRDLDGDSHADLQVTETWRYRDDFAGDDIGDGETAPAERSRRADRRVLVCPWIAGEDVWRCPVTPEPGQAIFADRASRGAGRGVRPWQ
ncbi:MAG: hypothetical protein K8H88_28895, partial [Sandaracinaceae bacterium]|nr:hypothetical protein [Sandaracinaceae bacterium]